MKKGLIIVLCLLLTACGSSKSDNENLKEVSVSSFNGDYYKMINNGRGTRSENFYLEFSRTDDLVTIGSGLQILSTKYFSTDSYYLSEGRMLTTDDHKALLRRDKKGTKEKDKIYPDTLQVPHGTTLDGVKDPVMVSQVSEQDYYQKTGSGYELKGLSFAIILDPLDQNNKRLEKSMSSDTIKSFSKEVIEKLYNFIQKKKKLRNKPILITVYSANDNDVSNYNGQFLYESYCNNKVGSMKKVSYSKVIFSSTKAKDIDPTTYTDFNSFKNIIKKNSTEASGIMGKANYLDGTIQNMKIEAHLNIKTYTELLYLASVIADSMETRFSHDFSMSTLVYSQDELMAIIVKHKGSDAQTTIIEQ